jgi:cytochrome bd-type quinol oxidase subunit 2
MNFILSIFLIAAGFIILILIMQTVGLVYPKKKDTIHGYWIRRVK